MLFSGALGALGVGIAKGGTDTAAFDGDPPRWASVLGVVLVLVGLSIGIGAVVWSVRSGRHRAARQSPLLTLSWSHRRRLGRQVRRGTQEAGEDPALLGETARQFAGLRWSAGLTTGLVVLSLGQALLRFAPFWAVLSAVLTVAGTVGVVLVLRDARRGEAFLRDHPDLAAG